MKLSFVLALVLSATAAGAADVPIPKSFSGTGYVTYGKELAPDDVVRQDNCKRQIWNEYHAAFNSEARESLDVFQQLVFDCASGHLLPARP